jgi:hypothetical protein
LLHEGKLRIEGRAPDGLQFTFADGRPYGELPPADVGLRDDVAKGLRCLGFSTAEARRAVAAAVGNTPEDLVRSALGVLRREKFASPSDPVATG